MSDRVLFISGRCNHCKKILIGIQQHSFLKTIFKIVNVDTQPYPNYIKSVPSIMISNQVISGQKVFEYFGKLVEEKKAHSERVKDNNITEKDTGQCRINEDGELEGYCECSLGDSGIDYSLITEENDDYTRRVYKVESSFDFLNETPGDIHTQVKNMEEKDSHISDKRKDFDNDLERMQRERSRMMESQNDVPMGRPPLGQGPGMGQNIMR